MTTESDTDDTRIHLRERPDLKLVHCDWKAAPTRELSSTSVYYEMSAADVAEVTCHACLDALVQQGESAVARVVELDREAGAGEVGGTCAHPSVFECTWCDEQFCIERACRARVHLRRDEVKTVAAQCRDCEKIEQEIEEYVWPLRSPGGQHVGVSTGVLVTHKPTGVAAFSCDERSQLQNRRLARLRLRAALGKLPADALAPTVFVGGASIDPARLRERIERLEASRSVARSVPIDEHDWTSALVGIGRVEPFERCVGGCSRGGEGPACGRPGCTG